MKTKREARSRPGGGEHSTLRTQKGRTRFGSPRPPPWARRDARLFKKTRIVACSCGVGGKRLMLRGFVGLKPLEARVV